MDIQKTIRDFLTDNMDIITFRALYDSDSSIEQFLQGIIDDIRDGKRPLVKFHIIDGDREYETAGEI